MGSCWRMEKSNTTPPPALISRREAAARFGVSVAFIDKIARLKGIPVSKVSARCVRLPLADLERVFLPNREGGES